MAQKTLPTDRPPEDYLATVEPPRRREEAAEMLALMRRVTGEKTVMWGDSIVGFGACTTPTTAAILGAGS